MKSLCKWSLASVGFWLAILIIFITPPSYGMELAVGTPRHSSHGQVLVPIHLRAKKGENPTCASLDLQYNPNLITFQKVQIEKDLIQQGKILQAREIKPGQVRIVIYGLNENSLSSGNIAIVYFQHQNILLAGTTSLKIHKAIGATGEANKLPIRTRTAQVNLNSTPMPLNALNNNRFSLNILLLLIGNIFIVTNLKGQKSLVTSYPKAYGRRWVDWCTLKTRDRPPPFLTYLPPPPGASDGLCSNSAENYPPKTSPKRTPFLKSPFLDSKANKSKNLKKKSNLYILAILILSLQWLILPQALTFAATYYVDFTNGNDANTGTSMSSPWKYAPGMSSFSGSYTSNPGDYILFKRGETWREQLTVPSSGSAGNPITFGAYGDGARPIIDGENIHNYCTYIVNRDYVTIDSIECKNANAQGILVDSSDYFTIKNSIISYAFYNGIRIRASAYSLIDDCTTYNNGQDLGGNNAGGGILFYGGTNNGIIQNSISYNNAEDGAAFGGQDSSDWAGSNNIIQDCDFYYNKESGIDIKNGSQIIRRNKLHHNGAGAVEGYGLLIAFDSESIIVENNEIYSNIAHGIGITSDVTGTCTIRYNNIYNNGNRGVSANGAPGSSFYYNFIYNNIGNGFALYNTGDTSSYSILNNVIWNNAGYQLMVQDEDSTVKNNILGGRDTAIAFVNDGITNTDSDYNILVGTGNYCRWGGTTTDFENYKTISGQDLNSISLDPQFINPPNDFHLQPTSPCIDAGIDVGLTEDFEGNPVPQGSAPDIGAYEFGSSPLKGDLNGDGKVNIQDVQCCVNHMLDTQDWGNEADVDGDGKVNENDVREIINMILNK